MINICSVPRQIKNVESNESKKEKEIRFVNLPSKEWVPPIIESMFMRPDNPGLKSLARPTLRHCMFWLVSSHTNNRYAWLTKALIDFWWFITLWYKENLWGKAIIQNEVNIHNWIKKGTNHANGNCFFGESCVSSDEFIYRITWNTSEIGLYDPSVVVRVLCCS